MRDIDKRYKEDVAKQRWKYNPKFCCINLDTEDLSPAICGKSYGTDEQMVVMTYAPDMLEMLENIIAMDEVSTAPLSRSDLDDIVAIIKKARDEDA